MTRICLACAFFLLLPIACSKARNPSNHTDYFNRGIAYADKQQWDKAIADFTEAIRLNPTDATYYYHRGVAYDNKKEHDKAIADITDAIRLDPTFADYFYSRGIAHSNKREYAEAISDYTEAIRLNPTDPDAHSNLAWLLATCPNDSFRHGTKALENATRACELSKWKNAPDLDTLAAAHAETGNFKEAVKWQMKAIELGIPDKAEEKKARQRLKLYEAGKPYRSE